MFNVICINAYGNDCKIDSSNFISNQSSIESGGYYIGIGSAIVNYCSFINNDYGLGNPINEGVDGTMFTNCIIDSNQTGAVLDWQVDFENCIVNNNQIGIWVGGDYSIVNCIINNNQTGINCEPSHNTVIKNCTIDSNSTIGIQFGGDSLVGCQIKNNGTGIYFQYGGIVTKNVIEDNNIGIR